MQSCGGGGYGPPDARDPEAVLRDVVDGRITVERAESEYRVAIDAAGRVVDEARTRTLRKETR